MPHPALLDEFDDPARVEINAKAYAAAILAQMLDRQAQAPWAGRAQHEPVGPFGEELLRQRAAEDFVVDPMVLGDNAALRNACGAAGFENISRLVPQSTRQP